MNKKWSMLTLAAAALSAASFASAATTTYDVNNASLWNSASAGGTNEATYGFDYSSLGIPQAPGSSSTTAMRLRANLGPTATAGGITVSPKGVNLSGDYAIHAEVWLNTFGVFDGVNSSGSGSTQFFGMGSGYSSGTNYRSGATTGGGTGTWFAADNEGGFSATSGTIRDYSAFTGTGAVATNFITDPTAYAANSVNSTNVQDATNPYYTALYPSVDVTTINGGALATDQDAVSTAGTQSGQSIAGAPMFAWHDMSITRTGDTVVWAIDGNNIATLNSSFNGGNPLTLDGGTSLTYFDATSGISGYPNLNFALVSNYSVSSVPEPASLGLLGIAGLGLLRRRRRV